MNRTLRIGIFTAIGVLLVIGFSVYVNDHPYWYRACNEVKIHVDDATGLRRKSPVKTLGLEIGYIDAVDLDGDRVLISVCVTGPVKLIPETRAYIRSSGFLGDKFLELKPMERLDANGNVSPNTAPTQGEPSSSAEDNLKNSSSAPTREPDSGAPIVPVAPSEEDLLPASYPDNGSLEEAVGEILNSALSIVTETAFAADPPQTLNASREAELQDTVKKVGKLIDQLTLMVGDLREVTQQKEFKETIYNLNAAMKHLEFLLRPTGKTMKNLDASVESLKNTMADAEAVVKKIKEGEGSLGKFINDPSIYDELKGAIQSINLLLGKAGALRTYVDISGVNIPAYKGTRGNFSILIAPNPGRYYLLGLTNDPLGRERKTTTTTSINGGTPTIEERTVNEEKGLRVTAMFGKYIGPFDFRVGLMEDYGAVSAGVWFDQDRKYGFRADVYSLGKGKDVTARFSARAQVWSSIYVTGGLDRVQKEGGRTAYFGGVGLFFDDDDLKYLLAFR